MFQTKLRETADLDDPVDPWWSINTITNEIIKF